MLKKIIILSCLCTFSAFVSASNEDWQANVSLSSVRDPHIAPPKTLVPKQSVQMTATVWMPEKVNWFPQFPDWDMPGATIVSMFMLSPSIERSHGSFTQRGATQNYLLTPLSEGALRLNQTSVTVYPEQKSSPILAFAPISVDVAMPPGAGDIAQFLPATDVKVTQSFYLLAGDKQEQELDADALKGLTLKSGQLIERRILIEAQGIQGKLIPTIPPESQVAEHQSEATDIINYDEFIGGTRTEHWYYSAQHVGTIPLKAVNIRWYDTDTSEFRTSKLDGVILKSAVANTVKPAFQLTLMEKLALLPDKTWRWICFAVAIVGVVVIFHRRMRQLLRKAGQASVRWIKTSPKIQFLWLCLHLTVVGVKNSQSRRHYQYWRLKYLTGKAQHAALAQWSDAAYGASDIRYPGRFRVIRGIIRQRATMKTAGFTFWHPCALPPLNGGIFGEVDKTVVITNSRQSSSPSVLQTQEML
ncbi:hypothetical protein GJV06_04140 [Enterobacteriaceae bacterium RIT691]|nr:hypothetical protein [Enterobacteriaceae bacterium RIT691]